MIIFVDNYTNIRKNGGKSMKQKKMAVIAAIIFALVVCMSSTTSVGEGTAVSADTAEVAVAVE